MRSILSYIQEQGGSKVFNTTKKIYQFVTTETTLLLQRSVGASQSWVNSMAQLASTAQVTGFDARATTVAKAAIASTDGFFAGGSIDGSTGNFLQKRGQAAPTMTCTRTGPGCYTVDFGAQRARGGFYPTILLSVQSAEYYSGAVNSVVIAVQQYTSEYQFKAVINDFSGGRAADKGVPVDQNWYFLVL